MTLVCRRPHELLAAFTAVAAMCVSACEAGVVASPDVVRDANARDGASDATPLADTAPSDVATFDSVSVDGAPSDVVVAIDARDASPTPDVAPDVSVHVCPMGGARDCSRGSGTGMADQCFDGPSCYVTLVQNAVRNVIAAHPTWFDMTGPLGCPVVLDVQAYMNGVVADLNTRGVCAIRDPNAPDEEVTVKHDNVFSENFDILASTGCARYGGAIYTGYCAPAWW